MYDFGMDFTNVSRAYFNLVLCFILKSFSFLCEKITGFYKKQNTGLKWIKRFFELIYENLLLKVNCGNIGAV